MKARLIRHCTTVLLLILLATPRPVPGQTAVKAPKTLEDMSGYFQDLVDVVSPAVVQIFASGYGLTSPQTATTTEGLISKRRSTGSGVILDPAGYIITNAHVIEGARRLQVQVPLPSGGGESQHSILKREGTRVGAQVVGVDRETDLAVLKVNGNDLPYLVLADSDKLRQGQIVFAFGSPFGLQNSVSMGVISSTARQLRPGDPMIYVQTDATINPGNSGGPLVNASGEVVGINTLILSPSGGSSGLGFAAPSNIVRTVFQQIRASGRVRRGHIGVLAQTITPTMAEGLRLGREWGVVLGDVYPGGPAAKAGLHPGDVVLSLDGKTMENGRQLEVNLYGRAIGETVSLEILRGTARQTIRVTVIERQDDPQRFQDMVKPEKNLIPRLGILALEVDRTIAQMLPPLREPDGVVVAVRAQDAPFEDDTLLPGDVIHSVNQRQIGSLKELRSAVDALRVGDAVVCQIERGGRMQFVAFEIDI